MRSWLCALAIFSVTLPAFSIPQIFVDPPTTFSAEERLNMAKLTVMYGEIAEQAEQKSIPYKKTEAYSRLSPMLPQEWMNRFLEFFTAVAPHISGRNMGKYLGNFTLRDLTMPFLEEVAPSVGAVCSKPDVDFVKCQHIELQKLIDRYQSR